MTPMGWLTAILVFASTIGVLILAAGGMAIVLFVKFIATHI